MPQDQFGNEIISTGQENSPNTMQRDPQFDEFGNEILQGDGSLDPLKYGLSQYEKEPEAGLLEKAGGTFVEGATNIVAGLPQAGSLAHGILTKWVDSGNPIVDLITESFDLPRLPKGSNAAMAPLQAITEGIMNYTDALHREIASTDTRNKLNEEQALLYEYVQQGVSKEVLDGQKQAVEDARKAYNVDRSISTAQRFLDYGKEIKKLNFTEERLNSDFIGSAAVGDVEGSLEAIGGTMIDLVSQMAASAATGGASLFTQSIGSVWEEIIDQGIEEGRSFDAIANDLSNQVIAGVSGLAIGALEKTGLESVFKPLAKPFTNRLKNAGARLLKGFLVEAPTEGMQEFAEVLGIDLTKVKSAGDLLPMLKNIVTDPEKLKRFANAAILGGLGGGILGGGIGAFDKVASNNDNKEVSRSLQDIVAPLTDNTVREEETVATVITALDEKAKKAELEESKNRVLGIKPQHKGDVKRALFQIFGFDENNIDDIEKVNAQVEIVDQLIGVAAKNKGISKKDWFNAYLREIRSGMPDTKTREQALDYLNQLVFHGGKESVQGVDEKTKVLGGFMHVDPRLGVAGEFAEKGTVLSSISAFELNDKGRWLETENPEGENYHSNKIAKALLQLGVLGSRNKSKVGAVRRWYSDFKPVDSKSIEKLVDSGVISQAEANEIPTGLFKVAGKSKDQLARLLSTKMSEILLGLGYDGTKYNNYGDVGISPETGEYINREGVQYGDEISGVKVSPEQYSYAVANPKALVKLAEAQSEYGSFTVDQVNELQKKLGKDAARMLMQNDMDATKAHAAVTFLEDGSAIISALNNPNATSFLHELVHVLGRQLSAGDQKLVMDWAGQTEWNREAEEKFARGFERYLAEGRSPVTKLELVFEKFKRWMTDIYKGITGSPIDIEISPEVQALFDRMLGKKEESAKKETKSKEDAVQESKAKSVDVRKPSGDGGKVAKGDTKKPAPTKETEKKEVEKEVDYAKKAEEFNKWFKGLDSKKEGYLDGNRVKKIQKHIVEMGEEINLQDLKAYQQYISEYVDLQKENEKAAASETKARNKIQKIKERVLGAKSESKSPIYQKDVVEMEELMSEYPDLVGAKTAEEWNKLIKDYRGAVERRAEAKAEKEKQEALFEAKEQQESEAQPEKKESGKLLKSAEKTIRSKKSKLDQLEQAKVMLEAIPKERMTDPQIKYRQQLLTEVAPLIAVMRETVGKSDFNREKKAHEDKIIAEFNVAEQSKRKGGFQTNQDAIDKAVDNYNKWRKEQGKEEISQSTIDRLQRLGVKKSFGKDEDILFQENSEGESTEGFDKRMDVLGDIIADADPEMYKRKAQQGHKVGRGYGKGVDANTLKLLVRLQEIMRMKSSEGKTKQADIHTRAEAEGRELTMKEAGEVELYNFAGITEASLDKLNYLRDVLDSIIEYGKSKKMEEIVSQSEAKVYENNLMTGAYNGVSRDLIYNPSKTYQPGDKVFHKGVYRLIGEDGKPSKGATDQQKFQAATKQQGKKKGELGIEKLLGFLINPNRLESLDSLLDKIMWREKGSKLFQTTLHKYISQPIRRAVTMEKSQNLRDKTEIEGAAKSIFGNNWRKQLKINSNPQEVKIPLKNGELARSKDGSLPQMSVNDLYYLWLSWQQADVRPSIESLGFAENSIQAVEKLLSPEVKAWARWQRDVFYKRKGAELSSAYEQAYGIPLDLVKNYVPVEKVQEKSEASKVSATGDTGFMNPSEVLNHFKERKDKSAPLKIVDGDAMLFRYMLKTNHFSTHFEPARRFRSLMADRSFRQAVESDFGLEAVKTLDQFARDITVGGTRMDDAVKAIEALRRNMVMATLGANLTMIPKQLSSFVAFAAHMPTGTWIKESANFWSNPVKHAKEIMEMDWTKERMDSGFERDMLELISARKITGKGRRRSIINAAMLPTRVGDVGAIIIGGWPLYNHYRKQFGAEKAMEKFIDIASNTQQSGDLMDLSSFQRGSGWEKLFTTYMTTPMQYWRLGTASVRRMIQGRGSREENAKVAAMYFVVLPAIFSMASGKIMGLFSDDDDERIDTIFDIGVDTVGQLAGAGIPIFNTVINYLQGRAKGERYPMRMSPLENTMESFAKGTEGTATFVMKMINEGVDADDMVKLAKEVSNAAGVLTGLPVKPISRTVEGAYDMATGKTTNPFRLLGQSKAAAGEDKKKKTSVRSARRNMLLRQR